MNTKNKSAARWQLILGYLGILAMMLACVTVGIGADQGTGTPGSDDVLIHLEDLCFCSNSRCVVSLLRKKKFEKRKRKATKQ